ncbi:MAG: class I tRNA ligase family protein [Coriobacteriales bacterium]|nr:class I tRNA ligase family protein [Coriobacteriales bacterium]
MPNNYNRPSFPDRAVVTAGMPYGNKGLHFGHIGGVFVPADIFARFLRDRIGAANVLFISGTDCYGSPIDEGYRKMLEAGEFSGSIHDYVEMNHQAQYKSLAAYDISLDIYEGSGLGSARSYHQRLTNEVFQRLYDHGHLRWLSTAQFFDEEKQSFLNGRQVEGKCPWEGCRSEQAYADECSLGHSYQPEELIDPISTLSGKPPVMRQVSNWYLDLASFKTLLENYIASLSQSGTTRKVVTDTMAEFLLPPIIYVRNDHLNEYPSLAGFLPSHIMHEPNDKNTSFELEFDNLEERDLACQILDKAAIRYRTGKTLVPFRLTGNIAWGVAAPDLEGREDKLTVWCWPESLWAPISFCQTYLGCLFDGVSITSLNPERPAIKGQVWQDYWCNPKSQVYQFIGQDNIYFYGVAQTPLIAGLNGCDTVDPSTQTGDLQQTQLVANYHLLYFGRKASSSGALRPPMADELLDYYTAEQLRAHFVALGLSLKQASFRPKPLNPDAGPKDSDPVLKDGQVLTNILNRLARSCFYTVQTELAGQMPLGDVSIELTGQAAEAVLAYELAMARQELHIANQIASDYVRVANKYWSDRAKAADNPATRRQLLTDCFYLLRVCLLLMHSIAPAGCRMVFQYLELPTSEADFFSWNHIDDEGVPSGFEPFVSPDDITRQSHGLKELPPRTDFFKRHPSQFPQ